VIRLYNETGNIIETQSTRAFSESRDGKTARCNQQKNEEGDQTAATKAAMAEEKVAN